MIIAGKADFGTPRAPTATVHVIVKYEFCSISVPVCSLLLSFAVHTSTQATQRK